MQKHQRHLAAACLIVMATVYGLVVYQPNRVFSTESASSTKLSSLDFEMRISPAIPKTSRFLEGRNGTVSNASYFVEPVYGDGNLQHCRTPCLFGQSPTYKVQSYLNGKILFSTTDGYISKSLQNFGSFDAEQIPVFDIFVRKGDTVFDVGANIGIFTLYFGSKVGKSGTVYAFEVQNHVSQILAFNVIMNELANVVLINSAVGSEEDSSTCVAYSVKGQETTGSGAVSVANSRVHHRCGSAQRVGSHSFVTTVVTLDSLAIKVDFLKIDAEGMEARVFGGANETITKHRPVIYSEDHSTFKGPRSKANSPVLFYLCRSVARYVVYIHRFEPALAAQDRVARGKSRPFYYENNVIGIPAERHTSEVISALQSTPDLRRYMCDRNP